MARETLGIIGYGNMGSAIVDGLVAAGVFAPSDIHVVETDADRRTNAIRAGYTIHKSITDIGKVSMVIIAVKPADVPEVGKSLTGIGRGTPVISIAAGVTIDAIKHVLPDTPVIRVMPNTPAMVGAGASVMALSSDVTDEQAASARTILGAVGLVAEVPEKLMDAVTGLSGSGPAFVAMMIEALSDGGVRMGLPRKIALDLAAQTVYGTSKMILEKGIHPSVLKEMVTSPGGTTIEGITALEAGTFRAAIIEAVTAAAERSAELGS